MSRHGKSVIIATRPRDIISNYKVPMDWKQSVTDLQRIGTRISAYVSFIPCRGGQAEAKA